MTRGFGIAAATDPKLVVAAARLVEELGYSTLWTNDNPMNADGMEVAASMIAATTRIRVGIGVMPIDSRPPLVIVSRLRELQLPLERLVLGLGAGFSTRPLRAVRTASEELRAMLGESATIGLAAMGPKMCALAGRIADVVLLNWMTPGRITWARSLVERSGRSPEVAAYVRCAIGPGATGRIDEEASRYAQIPHYGRHFEEMAAPASIGAVLDDRPNPGGALAGYDEVLGETVIRALPDPARPEEVLELARLAAPAH